MNRHDANSDSTLRQRAEELLKYTRDHISKMSIEDIQTLVCELQAHQIELQVINETLRQTQIQLADTRDYYRDLYEYAPIGYLTINTDRMIIQANSTASLLLSIGRDDLVGAQLLQLVMLEDQSAAHAHLLATTESTTPAVTELRFVRPDTAVIHVRLHTAKITDHQTCQEQWRVALTDITKEKQTLEALNRSEQRYRFLYEESQVVNIIIARDGSILDMNIQGLNSLGYRKEDIIGMKFSDLVIPQQRPMITQWLDEVLHDKRSQEIDIALYAHDNSIHIFMISPSSEMLYQDNTPMGILFCATNITERKHLEEELRRSETMARELILHAPSGIYEIDFTIPRFVTVNEVICHYLGYSREELLNMNPFDLLDEQSRNIFRQRLQKNLRGEETARSVEYGLKAKDGRVLYAILDISFIRKNGAVTGAFVIAHDITERKILEQQLRESESKLRNERELLQTIIDTIPVMIIIYNPKICKIIVNKAMKRITGWTVNDIQKTDLMELLFPDPLYRTTNADSMHSLEPGWRDITITCKNGLTLESSWASVEIPDGRLISIGIDITERKRMENKFRQRARELTAANKELESFSYSVSHDLRSPLRVIASFSDILLHSYADTLNRTGFEYLQRISRNAKKMDAIIDDMLKLSRISRQEMKIVRVDLTSMAHALFAELQQLHQDRTVTIVVQPDLYIEADVCLIYLAMSNLINNAWKYTSKTAHAQIELGTIRKDNDSCFYIRDNGSGFDMQYAQQLFKPFKRLHSDSEFPGTGIGLAIVQRVLQRHGGTIWAASEPEKGATFYFSLPIE